MRKFKIGDIVFYNGHVYKINAFSYFNDRKFIIRCKYTIEGCEEKYNDVTTAYEDELAPAHMQCIILSAQSLTQNAKYVFKCSEYKCTVDGDEIIIEKRH